MDAKEGGGEDFDWLEEKFKGSDFDDDVFGNVDDGSSMHDGVSGSAAAPHRPFKGDNVNATPDRPSEGDTSANNDPPLEDDKESLVDFDDDLPTLTAAKEPEFNVQTDMRKLVLQKGMKFPNSKVFREKLREYAIKKPVDIKFKLNEKKKISVYCINECGLRCYASQLSGELTFQIKTFNPKCTCPRSFKHSQVTLSYVAKSLCRSLTKIPIRKWLVFNIM